MLLRGPNVLKKLKMLAPPFDAETERELIATALLDLQAPARAAALALVHTHIKDGKRITTTLKRYRSLTERQASEKLGALRRDDVPQLSVALTARRAAGFAPAFEDRSYVRALLPKQLAKQGTELVLTRTPLNCDAALATIPDAVFDEMPAFRARHPFTKLTLREAPLTTFPRRFLELAPFLRSLDIAFSDLDSLPDEICACTNLEELSFVGAKIARLNPKLVKLKKLRRLSLGQSTAMTKLPLEVCELPLLEQLDLWWMKCALPAEIGRLSALKKLDLRGAKIRKLPPEIAQCVNLKQVTVVDSSITARDVKALLPRAKVS